MKKGTAEVHIHEKMTPSCSHMTSMGSNQPVLSHCPSSLNAGLLQCIWKDGLPHFELSLDDPIAVYTANPLKVQGNERALDYVYMILLVSKEEKIGWVIQAMYPDLWAR
jgi:hypothetical protein